MMKWVSLEGQFSVLHAECRNPRNTSCLDSGSKDILISRHVVSPGDPQDRIEETGVRGVPTKVLAQG